MSEGNQLGKRYRCETCGLELLCVAHGAGRFSCCGVPMAVIEMKPLAAGD